MSKPAPTPPFFLLAALAAMGTAAMNMPLSAMPSMAKDLNTSYSTIQLILTLFLFSIAISTLIIGHLSDRYGRRVVMLACLVFYMSGGMICALATVDFVLILGRVVQAMGGAAGIVVGRAIIRDLYEREKAASLIGYLTMVMVVAPMVAPAVGGILDEKLGWRSIFWMLFIFGTTLFVLALKFLPETNQRSEEERAGASWIKNALRLLSIPSFWGFSFVMGFASGMYFAFLGGAPYISIELMGLSPSEYGFYFISVAASYMVGNFLSGRYVQRVGGKFMMMMGTYMPFIGLAMIWTAAGYNHPAAIFVPMSIISFCNGLAIPSASAGAVSVDPNIAGSASGVSGFLQLGIGALLSFAVGWLQHYSLSAMMIVMTFSGFCAVIGLLLTRVEKNAIRSA